MRRINTLFSVPIIFALIAGCATGDVPPTETGGQPPKNVPTLPEGRPHPNATEPGARPTETASVDLPTATPEVHIGYGGPLSDQAIEDIQEGKYVGQIDGTPLAENYDPFRVNEVITVQQALDQGYSPEMAEFLDGSVAEFRSGMLTRVRDGKAIAYVGEQSRRWEKLQEFPTATTHESAKTLCRIEDKDIESWYLYQRLNDSTGQFSENVIHWPLVESRMLGGPSAGTHVYWGGTDKNANPRYLFENPDVRPTKRVAFCTLDRGEWIETIRVVKYLNPSGKISWGMLRGNGGGSQTRFDDFPVIEWKIPSLLSWNDPTTVNLLRDWAASMGEKDFPKSLEGKLLFEIN